MMVLPDNLRAGDKIGILSTARKINKEELSYAIACLEEWGYVPVLGQTIEAEQDQFAGSDQLRADDLQNFTNDDNIKAILCARGGYGTVRIIDKIDFTPLINKPKWIIGYSDVTVIHSHLHQLGIATLHATMPINFPKSKDESQEAIASLRSHLKGEKLSYTDIEAHQLNRSGKATGQIVGGNLSIIYSLLGSPSSLDTDGKILFLEDLDEYLYHIDRMMMNIKRNGLLDQLAGLIIGGMSDMNDNAIPYGKSAVEIIAEHLAEYDYPVMFNFPAGHIKRNLALPLGKQAEMVVGIENKLSFT